MSLQRGAAMMRRGILGGMLVWAAVLPAHAASDITLSGNAALLTQYVDRGLTMGPPTVAYL